MVFQIRLLQVLVCILLQRVFWYVSEALRLAELGSYRLLLNTLRNRLIFHEHCNQINIYYNCNCNRKIKVNVIVNVGCRQIVEPTRDTERSSTLIHFIVTTIANIVQCYVGGNYEDACGVVHTRDLNLT